MKTIAIDISPLNDPNRTGIGVYIYNLVKAILESDRENQYILFGFSTIATHSYLKNLDLKNYPNVQIKVFKLPAKAFRTFFLLWQKANFPSIEYFIGKVDIIHNFNWYLPPKNSAKLLATVFDTTAISHPDWHQKQTSQLDTLRFERIKKYADLVIAISNQTKKDFLQFSPNSAVEIVYPASSLQISQVSKNEENKILKKYHLTSGYILSVATLEPRKNIAALIKAYNQSKIARKLVLTGKIGWKNEELLNLAKDNKDIILTDFVSEKELGVLYKNANCLAYPSLYEGFGIPVLEAMEFGTVIITSNSSSLPEVGGSAALYVNPKSVKSIMDALKKIDKDTLLRKRLINLGKKQRVQFSWEKSAKKMIEIYNKL